MKGKPSVLIVSSWYPGENDPTNGSFVHEQAKMLMNNGHAVVVLKPNLNGNFIQTLKAPKEKNLQYNYQGVQVIEVNVNVYFPKIKHFYFKKLINGSSRILQKLGIDFDIVHSHSLLSGGIVATAIAQQFNRPLFHTEHWSGLIFHPKKFSQSDNQAIRKLHDQAKNVFFVSDFARKNSIVYNSLDQSKHKVIPNLVDSSFFDYPIIERQPQLIVIGDFSERKNQLLAVKAWRRYMSEFPESNYQLILAGNDFDQPEFTRHTIGLPNLRIIKRLNRLEVVEYIARSKVLISTSKLETFGLTIAEALALGVPVLATNSGGSKEIVLEGDGFLVEQDDEYGFYEKLKRVLSEPFASETIRQSCVQRFSESQIYQQLNAYYGNHV